MTKLLIVDDEILVRVGIKSAINWQEYGFEIVGEASNGAEALEILHQTKVDILLLDIEMPIMNGLELLEVINEEGIGAKVIILSCHDEFEFTRKALVDGALDYILKLSLDPDQLLELLISVQKDLKKDEIITNKALKPDMTDMWFKLIYDNDPKLWEQQKESGIKLKDAPLLVCVVSIDGYKTKSVQERIQDNHLFEKSITNILSELVNEYSSGASFKMDDGLFVGIMNIKVGHQRRLKEIAENIQNSLWRYLQISVSIGLGPEVESIKSIGESYRWAVAANRRRFFEGKNSIIIYDESDFDMNADTRLIHFDTVMEKKLSACIEFGDKGKSLEIIGQYFDLIRQRPYTSNLTYIYREIDGIMNLFSRELKLHKQQFEDIPGYITPENGSDLHQIEFIDDLQEWLSSFNELFYNHLEKLQDLTARKEFQSIIEYIHEHYAENLRMALLAKRVNMSSSYFGTMFKKAFGTNLSTYITDYRMDRAAELLRSTKMSVTEISERVGYENIYYFSNVFKKNYGISPNQYRRKQ